MLPFFVLHGEADIVTDPEVSKALYKKASSRDKTIKLYSGMWHGLTFGETEENIEIVFADIIAWLDKHSRDIIVQPILDGHALSCVTPSAAVTQSRNLFNGSYLCGLKGRRTLHHVAI